MGPFTVTKPITNVNYEITLDKDNSVKKVVHRNHLIEYFSKEETLPELISNYCPLDDESKTFYQNFSAERGRKLNKILTNGSFKTLDPVEIPPPILTPRTQNQHLELDNSLTDISKLTPETHTVQRPIGSHQDPDEGSTANRSTSQSPDPARSRSLGRGLRAIGRHNYYYP